MRSLLLVILALLMAGSARAAAPDPRAEASVQLSETECVVILVRFKAIKLTSEAEQDAHARIGVTCAFKAIEKKLAAAQKEKEPKEPDWATKRQVRKLARDAVEQLAKWITPSEAAPMTGDQSNYLNPIRLEFREVLAGRDPYGAR